MPCNRSGYFTEGYRFGLVSFDWNNAADIWSKNRPMKATCEEALVEQAKMVKSKNPYTRVTVYKNFELALQWLSSERAAMYDKSKSDFFLKYQSGSQKGNIYNEVQGHYGDQFFWNFTNSSAVDYFINTVSLGARGVASPYVDGIFTDDLSGLGEEHPNAAKNMGLSSNEVATIHTASNDAWNKLLKSLISHNAYNFAAL